MSTATGGARTDPTAAELELDSVTKRFGDVVAVDDVDLVVQRGEFVTLLGASGSGKTTILRMVAGFETPSAGRIRISGREAAHLPPNKREVGLVFQSYALFPHMTVNENIGYSLKVRRWRADATARRVREVVELLRLGGLERRRPHELSGGQQQRVALGRALAFQPTLLLMDEPLGALDRGLRADLQVELRRIHREVGTTMVSVTHDQEESLTLSTRIALLDHGKVIQFAEPRTVFEDPANDFVARFMGACNLWDVTGLERTPNGRFSVRFGRWAATVRGTGSLGDPTDGVLLCRPTQLRPSPRTGDLVIAATVTDVVFLGEHARVTATSDVLGGLLSEAPAWEARDLRPGAEIGFGVSEDDLLLVARAGGSPRPAVSRSADERARSASIGAHVLSVDAPEGR